jgi:hypothetical protein
MAAVVSNPDLAGDLSARAELDLAGLGVGVAMYQPDRAHADRTQAAIKAGLATIASDQVLRFAFPDLAVERDATIVRVRGRVPTDLLAKLAEQFGASLL